MRRSVSVRKFRVRVMWMFVQLAQRLNILEKDIKEIEAGKAVENRAMLSKVRRALGISSK